MSFPSRHVLALVAFLITAPFAGSVVAAATSEPWPFDQRQILLVSTEGQSFPDDLTTAQIMDVFARKGRVRWVMQKAAPGRIAPVLVPRDFPWHSSVAVRNLGLRYKTDGLVSLTRRGVLVELRWYSTLDGQPLFFESVSLPDAGPRPGEDAQRKQRLQDWLTDMWSKIPGRGYVVKRDLTTLTLEGAAQEGLKLGDKVEIRRLQEVKRHPLLKTLVGIESSSSGLATITVLGDPLSTAKVDYESNTDPIQEGDRYLPRAVAPVANLVAPSPGIPSPSAELGSMNPPAPQETTQHTFEVSGGVLLGTISHEETVAGSTTPIAASSFAPGLDLRGKAFLTREWYFGGDVAYAFLNFSGLDATKFGAESASGEYSNVRFYGAYRFIFLESEQGQGGFDLAVGYRRASASFAALSAATAPSSKTFAGLDVGFGVHVPVDAGVSVFFRADRIFGSSLLETPLTGGSATSSVVWNFEGGAKYKLNAHADVTGGISFFRANASYTGTGTRATASVASLTSGTLFNIGYTQKF